MYIGEKSSRHHHESIFETYIYMSFRRPRPRDGFQLGWWRRLIETTHLVPNSEGERIKAHEDKISWQTRSRKTHAEEFLTRPTAARPQLGVALRSIWDWAVRAWTFSLTPGQSLVKSNLKKWGLAAIAQCDCGHGDKTFFHHIFTVTLLIVETWNKLHTTTWQM